VTLAVQATGLRRSFGELVAVGGVDLAIPEREVFGIVGPDGAGKTTLLRLLVGVLAADQGSVQIVGHDLVKQRYETRFLLGYMSQAFSLYQDLTVLENIAFFASLRRVSRADRDARSKRLLAATGLAPFTKRRAGQLSGGMKQKLGLICTLVHEPKVLFLDEPTNGVDPVSRREFWDILGELRAHVTVVVSTPSLDEAERCDRVALMTGGKLLRVDTPDKLRFAVTLPVWEVQASDAVRAFSALEAAMPPNAAQLFGDRVHVVTDHPEAELHALLAGAGLTAAIRQVEPSLEDAYVQLVGAEQRA